MSPGTRALCASGGPTREPRLSNQHEIHEDEDELRTESASAGPGLTHRQSCDVLGQNSSQSYSVTTYTKNSYTSCVNNSLTQQNKKVRMRIIDGT